jgi:hypothetical protein
LLVLANCSVFISADVVALISSSSFSSSITTLVPFAGIVEPL